MTLKSHPGKALTRDPREKYIHKGHEGRGEVRWYRLGDKADACVFFFEKKGSEEGKE